MIYMLQKSGKCLLHFIRKISKRCYIHVEAQ
uniref:Uncharacterized protein n=1 Tax=Arundo donax TaxID=35708 RepID=A0A0A8Y3W7_ARUDO